MQRVTLDEGHKKTSVNMVGSSVEYGGNLYGVPAKFHISIKPYLASPELLQYIR